MLRVLQDLIKLDYPTEILDKAVGICLKRADDNPVGKEINCLLSMSSGLDLGKVPFFNLIYSMILDI